MCCNLLKYCQFLMQALDSTRNYLTWIICSHYSVLCDKVFFQTIQKIDLQHYFLFLYGWLNADFQGFSFILHKFVDRSIASFTSRVTKCASEPGNKRQDNIIQRTINCWQLLLTFFRKMMGLTYRIMQQHLPNFAVRVVDKKLNK